MFASGKLPGHSCRSSVCSKPWAAARLGSSLCLLCVSSFTLLAGAQVADSDDAIQKLQSQIADLQEALSSLRAEQTEQRKRLDQCRCAEDRSASESDVVDMSDLMETESDTTTGPIVNVDVANTDWLKEVLFGGKPWLIYCDDKKSIRREPTPPVFQESASQLDGLATFGAIDCWERTASGKTLAHRFDFQKPPVVFAVANGDPPLVVDLDGVTKPWQLRRKVQSHLRANVTRIDSPQTFKSLCTSRRACLMVGFKNANMLADTLAVLQPVLEEHRGVRAVAVDTSVWKVKLDDKLAATKPKKKDGQKEQSSIICLARQAGGHGRAGAFLRLTGDSGLKAEHLAEFLDRCAGGKSLVPIADLPQVSFRKPEVPKYKAPQSGTGTSSASPKPAPASVKPSAKKTAPSGKGSTTAKKSSQKTRPMPHYSSPGTKKPFSKSKPAARKQDRVGSRDALEEEEPLFSAVEDEGDLGSEESPEDEADEELEL